MKIDQILSPSLLLVLSRARKYPFKKASPKTINGNNDGSIPSIPSIQNPPAS